jgi:hypothetical protein
VEGQSSPSPSSYLTLAPVRAPPPSRPPSPSKRPPSPVRSEEAVEAADLLTPPARRPHRVEHESAVLVPTHLGVGAEEAEADNDNDEEALLTGGTKRQPPTFTRPRVLLLLCLLLLLLCLLVVGAPLLLAPLFAARGGAPRERAVLAEGGDAAVRPSQAQALPLTRRAGRGGRGGRGKFREGAGKGGSPGARHHKQLKRRAAAAASSTPSEQSART